jgi:predicted nucleic acid-binding protein
MITAVDTNVLLDVLLDDSTFGEASAVMLERCIKEGRIIACDVVWAETAANYISEAEFKKVIDTLGLELSPLGKESAFLAGGLWKSYRNDGGKRSRIVADFMIGAHAMTQAQRLLSRDRGFYRKYFKELVLLDPAHSR